MMNKTNLVNFYNNNYYKVYDILSENLRMELLEDCNKHLLKRSIDTMKPKGINDPFPPEDAEFFFSMKLLKKECWKNLTKQIFIQCLEYYKLISDKKIYLESCWINKVGSYCKEDEESKLCFHEKSGLYTENEYHIHRKEQIVSAVYYLQNNSEECGTIIRCPEGELIMNGRQNSLSIFNPGLYHSPLMPNRECSSKNPRYVVVMGFQDKKIEDKNHNI